MHVLSSSSALYMAIYAGAVKPPNNRACPAPRAIGPVPVLPCSSEIRSAPINGLDGTPTIWILANPRICGRDMIRPLLEAGHRNIYDRGIFLADKNSSDRGLE